MTDVVLHVGHRPADTKARVLDAIRRAEAGDTRPEAHITFESWEGLARILTGQRLELLRHVRHRPASSVAELGRTLGRDYKRVHEDVESLVAVGLLDRTEEGSVRTAYDEIRAVISLDPAA